MPELFFLFKLRCSYSLHAYRNNGRKTFIRKFFNSRKEETYFLLKCPSYIFKKNPLDLKLKCGTLDALKAHLVDYAASWHA